MSLIRRLSRIQTTTGDETRTGSLRGRLVNLAGRFILPWIALMLVLYIAVHSPLREIIAARFGMGSRGCFFCTAGLTGQGVVDALAAFWLILAASAGAWVLTWRLEGAASERALAFGLLGLGLVAIPAAVIGEAADLLHRNFLRPPLGPIITALPAMTIVIIGLWQGWRPHKISLGLVKAGGLSLLIIGLGTAMLASSSAISLLHPPSGYDALSYHGPMAVFIWQDGSLGAYLDRVPGIWALAHPGVVEIWVGLLRLVGGDSLANLGQLPFALLGCTAVYVFTRRLGLWRRAALLAAASFLLMPMVVMQAGMQLNDLAAAALLMAVIALASAPISGWKTDRLALIGVGLGLAATAKLVLLPGVFGVGLFAVAGVLSSVRRGLTGKRLLFQMAVLAFSFLMVVAPWWLRNVLRYGNPVFPAALPFLGQGFYFSNFNKADLAFVPRPAAWLIYPFLEPHDELSGLGTLFAVCLVPGIIMAAWRGRRQPLLLFGGVALLMLVFWWFLSERFPRFLLAPAGLCFAFVPWALLAIPRRLRKAGVALVAVAAIFSTLVTFQQALLPFGRQPITRSDFYDQVWGLDPAVLALPE